MPKSFYPPISTQQVVRPSGSSMESSVATVEAQLAARAPVLIVQTYADAGAPPTGTLVISLSGT